VTVTSSGHPNYYYQWRSRQGCGGYSPFPRRWDSKCPMKRKSKSWMVGRFESIAKWNGRTAAKHRAESAARHQGRSQRMREKSRGFIRGLNRYIPLPGVYPAIHRGIKPQILKTLRRRAPSQKLNLNLYCEVLRNSNSITISIRICTARFRGIWVARFWLVDYFKISTPLRMSICNSLTISSLIFSGTCYTLSFLLSWVAKTQLNHRNHFTPKKL